MPRAGCSFLRDATAPLMSSSGEMVDSEVVDICSRLEGIDLSLSLRAPHCERLPLRVNKVLIFIYTTRRFSHISTSFVKKSLYSR